MNKAIICGRLGQDPELKYIPSGTAVCNFSVATSKKWTDKSGHKQEKTQWHRIVIWGKLAELCNKYLQKGREVLLEGEIETRNWEAKDGTKRYMTEIVASNVQFLSGGNQGQKNHGGQGTGSDRAAENLYSNTEGFAADDIPF